MRTTKKYMAVGLLTLTLGLSTTACTSNGPAAGIAVSSTSIVPADPTPSSNPTTPSAAPSPPPTDSAAPEPGAPAPTPATTEPSAPAPAPDPARGASPAAETPPVPAPEPEVPVREDGNPDSFMSFEPITTPEQAIEVIMEHFDHNPDVIYDAFLNEYGNFDVKIRSLSIMEQDGSGTVGIYEVEPNGNRFEKGSVIRE